MPQAILLLPGFGAQGATPADVARAFTSGPASALVTVSRSVIYAYRFEGDDWRAAAAQRPPGSGRGLGGLGLVDRRPGRAGRRAARVPRGRHRRLCSCPVRARRGIDAHRSPPSPPPPRRRRRRPAAGRRFYRIRPGDTLAAIAPRFGLTEVELLALNPGIEPTALRIGQRIRVR